MFSNELIIHVLEYCEKPRIRSRIAEIAVDYSQGSDVVDFLLKQDLLKIVRFPKIVSKKVTPYDGFEFYNRHRTHYIRTEKGKELVGNLMAGKLEH